MGKRKVYGELLTPSGIIGPTTADLVIQLGDAAGTYALSIVDSATSEVADINSDGALTVVTATVSSGLGVTGASTFSGAVTVGGTLTASSAISVSAASTFSGNVTVGGALTASSGLGVTAASTFSGAVTVSGTLTASSSGLVSGGLTVSKTITGSSNATVDGTLTASSNLTLSGKLTHSLQSVSSGQALGVHNVSVLTATGSTSYTLPAAAAGYYKAIFKSANSTAILTVDTNSTNETFDGSSATKLTFNGKDQKVEMVGLSTARWLIISSTASVGDIST